ncbi:small, acid-soluble spore protein, alpha/beta type [Pseudalkalibacillus sp. SCS-8]|uniref:small, acid-soluble spore protein, alpha/beta type n=1 Tax=Pseudalkalibacillus nanhaiensis TaxID=3115291 RepID=UPI0032DA334C
MKKNALEVPGCEQAVQGFREEFAEEFGMYRPAAERESITKKLVDQKQKEEQ